MLRAGDGISEAGDWVSKAKSDNALEFSVIDVESLAFGWCAEARAIVPSTLLVLDETRFRRLVKRSPILRETVRKSAEKRGITLDQSLSDSAQADS